MKNLFVVIALSCLLLSLPTSVKAVEPLRPFEFWACNYKDGKDKQDLLAARDYAAAQAKRAKMAPINTFLWNLAKGDRSIDFLWMRSHATYADWASYTDTAGTHPDMAKVAGRFDAVADCYAGMAATRRLHAGSAIDNPDRYVISSLACRTKPDVTAEGLNDLETYIAEHRDLMGDAAPLYTAAYRTNTSGPRTPHWVLFDLHNSFGARVTYHLNATQHPGTERLNRHMDMKVECDPALWIGQRVISSND
jgi:hypothetical protein